MNRFYASVQENVRSAPLCALQSCERPLQGLTGFSVTAMDATHGAEPLTRDGVTGWKLVKAAIIMAFDRDTPIMTWVTGPEMVFAL